MNWRANTATRTPEGRKNCSGEFWETVHLLAQPYAVQPFAGQPFVGQPFQADAQAEACQAE